jgi:1L-myo-inositol 1-phosphate cytidylyltransferase
MTTVNECLILAAGNGSRIASLSGSAPKPLVPLLGAPLLEHILLSSHTAGIDKFVIVVGYRGDAIRRWIADQCFQDFAITLIENLDYHKANGVSALAAKPALRNPFLLLMADHIFEPKTARALLQQRLAGDEVILGVDRNVDRIFDLDEATKVSLEGTCIVDIGKDLPGSTLDTGMFLCSPALFERLESANRDGNCSLSDGGRIALVSDANIAGKTIITYNLHLESKGDDRLRESQLEETLEDIRQYSADIPILLAGDFNLDASGGNSAAAIRQQQFQDVFANHHVATTPNTLFETGRTIDWIFSRGPICPDHSQVHRSVAASDHYPLSVTLRFV